PSDHRAASCQERWFCLATSRFAVATPSNEGLVCLDMALQKLKPIRLNHQLADLIAHSPCGLVGHAQGALQLFAADAVPRRDEKINRVKPHLQRRPRILEDRPGARIHVMPAMSARVGGTIAQLVERAVND